MTQLGFLLLVVFAAGGAALLAAFFLGHSVSAHVRKRVDLLVAAMARAPASRAEADGPRSRVDILKWVVTLGMPRKWGVRSQPLMFALAGFTGGAVAWLLFELLLGLPAPAAIPLVTLGAWAAPHLLARMEQGKTEKRFEELFPDAIDMIVRMLRAGLPVSAAIRTVAQEAPAPINGVFAVLADQIGIGMSFDDALGIGSERIGLADFRFFAAAVALQHATGGNLVVTLDILAEIIRRRHAVRMKARSATAEVRMSAYVLGAMPFLVFGALLFINPGYLTPLMADPRGNVMLAIVVGLLVGAFVTMREMMRSVTHT